MDNSNRVWCEEIDSLLLKCEEKLNPSGKDSEAIVRQLHRLLMLAPEAVKQHFGPPPEGNVFEPLFEHNALEKILFELTRNVGLMISRSPSGRVMATVAVPDLSIECSFSSEKSLPVAMTGAIAAAALDVLGNGRDPQATIN